MLAGKLKILDQKPNEKRILEAQKVITEKDAVILAEAKEAGANFLVTLDKKHFLTPAVERFLGKQKALTPKMLIEEIESE